MKKFNFNVLVTGSAGYIGTLLVQKLKENNCNVIEYDIANNAKSDVRDTALLAKILDYEKIDIVYHLGAERNIGFCQQDKQHTMDVNATATINLYNECKRRKIYFVFASSLAVEFPSANFYAESKYKAELAITKRACIVKLANVAGVYEGMKAHKFPSLVDNIITSMTNNIPLNVYGDCKRNYVFIDDVVDEFLSILKFDHSIKQVDYLMPIGTNLSTLNLINYFEKGLSLKILINYFDKKPLDAYDLSLKTSNNSKIEKIIKSYKPIISKKLMVKNELLSNTSVDNFFIHTENERYILKTAFKSNQMVLSRTELNPFQKTRGHKHDNEEIYVFENDCGLMLGDSFHMVHAGDVVLIPSDTFHQVLNNSHSVISFNCFYPKKSTVEQ